MKPSIKNTNSSKEDMTMTTMTNYRTLEMEELEIVSGGTVTELDELISAIEGNGFFGDLETSAESSADTSPAQTV